MLDLAATKEFDFYCTLSVKKYYVKGFKISNHINVANTIIFCFYILRLELSKIVYVHQLLPTSKPVPTSYQQKCNVF